MKISTQQLFNFWAAQIGHYDYGSFPEHRALLKNLGSVNTNYLQRLGETLGAYRFKPESVSGEELEALKYVLRDCLKKPPTPFYMNRYGMFLINPDNKDTKLDVVRLAKLLYAAKGGWISPTYAPPTKLGEAVKKYLDSYPDGDDAAIEVLAKKYTIPNAKTVLRVFFAILNDEPDHLKEFVTVREINLTEEQLNKLRRGAECFITR